MGLCARAVVPFQSFSRSLLQPLHRPVCPLCPNGWLQKRRTNKSDATTAAMVISFPSLSQRVEWAVSQSRIRFQTFRSLELIRQLAPYRILASANAPYVTVR